MLSQSTHQLIAARLNERLANHLGPMKQTTDKVLGSVEVVASVSDMSGQVPFDFLGVMHKGQLVEAIQCEDAHSLYYYGWHLVRRVYREACKQYNEQE